MLILSGRLILYVVLSNRLNYLELKLQNLKLIFRTCDQDKYLTEWHLCRRKCEMVYQQQKAFNPDLYNGYCEFPIKNGTCNFRHEHLIYD